VADEGAPATPLPPKIDRRLGADRPRLHRTVIAIIVVAAIVGFFAAFAVWVKRQALETDTWTQTSTQLLANHAVQDAVAGFLVQALYDNVNVEGEVKKALPKRVQPLAGPAAGGLREFATTAATEALQRPDVQELWGKANATAHAEFLKLINGGGEALSTTGGEVNLNLATLITDLGDRVGINVKDKIPASAAQVTLLRSDQLSLAQRLVRALKALSILLPLLTLALFGLAIYLAGGWRRVALRSCGIAILAIGILILVARSKPAVDAVWSIGTSLLRDEGVALIWYGVVIVLGAWLAGRTAIARDLRREIAPILRERLYGYAVLAAFVLLVYLWSPTEGTRRLLPALILIALLIAGFEALRHQTVAEHPDATVAVASEHWRERLSAAGGWVRRRPRAMSSRRGDQHAPTGEDVRLDQLERLARLRAAGVLDDEELRAEKSRILGP
jgi:hypothetical protein